jgi:hypothetical protein
MKDMHARISSEILHKSSASIENFEQPHEQVLEKDDDETPTRSKTQRNVVYLDPFSVKGSRYTTFTKLKRLTLLNGGSTSTTKKVVWKRIVSGRREDRFYYSSIFYSGGSHSQTFSITGILFLRNCLIPVPEWPYVRVSLL